MPVLLAQAHIPLPPQNPDQTPAQTQAPDQAQPQPQPKASKTRKKKKSKPAKHSQTSIQTQPQAPDQGQAQLNPSPDSPQQMSVQARIRARREQRRAAAMHDVYSHNYELFADVGYLRFQPGTYLQRLTYYAWDTGGTRYFNERLGLTLDGRGYYGTAYVGLNPTNVTRPSISQYDGMAGPTYRFFLRPKFSLAARVVGGVAYGNFSADTNGFGAKTLGLYPDGYTFAANGSVIGEYNFAPNIGFKLAPEFHATGFGSSFQKSVGFTGGIVYRFGKQ
jgi:hypothetical protein